MAMTEIKSVLFLYGLNWCLGFSLGGPLMLSNGNLDQSSVEKHILQLEASVSRLQSQFKLQEEKQAALLSSLLSKLASTSDELQTLKRDYHDLESKHNSSLTQLASVKMDLSTNTRELESVKNELKTLETKAIKTDLVTEGQGLHHLNINVTDELQNCTYSLLSPPGDLNSTKFFITDGSETFPENSSSLGSECFIQRAIIKVIDENFEKIAKDVKSAIVSQTYLQNEVARLTSKVENTGSIISGLQPSGLARNYTAYARTVAFSAALNHSDLISEGGIVKHDQVILNIGNGYNGTTGIFTCPQSGIYSISFKTLSEVGATANLQLYHNQEEVVSAFAYAPGRHDSGGNSAVMSLKRGDNVYVKAYTTAAIFNQPGNKYSAFSGFRIGDTL